MTPTLGASCVLFSHQVKEGVEVGQEPISRVERVSSELRHDRSERSRVLIDVSEAVVIPREGIEGAEQLNMRSHKFLFSSCFRFLFTKFVIVIKNISIILTISLNSQIFEDPSHLLDVR